MDTKERPIMKKMAIIASKEKANWHSCQIIDKNLLNSYRLAFSKKEFKLFNYNTLLRHDQIDNLAREIIDYSPDGLIHINHRPHIEKLLVAIEKQVKSNIWDRPSLYIHVYGDFTLYLPQWYKIENTLKKYPCLFIGASDRQVSLLKKLLYKADAYVKKCPFPVDEKLFFYSSKIREASRKKLRLKEKQFAFVYTGRLSYQKNILSLLNSFSFFLKNTKFDSKLYLAGQFDDLGQPFLGKYLKENEFFYHYNSTLDSLPKQDRNKIVFLGLLTPDELRELYNAGDCYINLSTHNDEDYGMSPAEALCCGLPCILTDWGGFSSFAKMGDEHCCQLIPVKIDNEGINYKENHLLQTMIKSFISPLSDSKRNQLSKHFCKCVSLSSVSRIVKNFHNCNTINFKGFSELMKTLANPVDAIEMTFSEPFKKYTDEYMELYKSYEL